MTYLTQKTIKEKVSFSGIALHNGLNVNVSIKPANPNFGIVFKRKYIYLLLALIVLFIIVVFN